MIPFSKKVQIKLKLVLQTKVNQRSAKSCNRLDFVKFHENVISTQEAGIRDA